MTRVRFIDEASPPNILDLSYENAKKLNLVTMALSLSDDEHPSISSGASDDLYIRVPTTSNNSRLPFDVIRGYTQGEDMRSIFHAQATSVDEFLYTMKVADFLDGKFLEEVIECFHVLPDHLIELSEEPEVMKLVLRSVEISSHLVEYFVEKLIRGQQNLGTACALFIAYPPLYENDHLIDLFISYPPFYIEGNDKFCVEGVPSKRNLSLLFDTFSYVYLNEGLHLRYAPDHGVWEPPFPGRRRWIFKGYHLEFLKTGALHQTFKGHTNMGIEMVLKLTLESSAPPPDLGLALDAVRGLYMTLPPLRWDAFVSSCLQLYSPSGAGILWDVPAKLKVYMILKQLRADASKDTMTFETDEAMKDELTSMFEGGTLTNSQEKVDAALNFAMSVPMNTLQTICHLMYIAEV